MSSDRKPRIAVVGSNMVDLVTYVNRMPVRGETIEAPRFEMGHGGKGANQAVAAARLGASVLMVSAVGDDMFADNTIKNLALAGVDTKYIRRVAGRSSGVAPIMVEPSGENSILIVKGANSDLSPADVERAAQDLKACDLILLQLEIPLETVYAAIAFGKRHGVRTVLNPAPATPELDPERVRDVSFFVPNETELAILTGMPVGTEEEIGSGGAEPDRQGRRDGHRHPRFARRAACDRRERSSHRPGPGRAFGHDRRRGRLCRQFRALFRRRPRPRAGARPRRPLRRQFRHPARNPEGLRDGGSSSRRFAGRSMRRSASANKSDTSLPPVIPGAAGRRPILPVSHVRDKIPACAGMTHETRALIVRSCHPRERIAVVRSIDFGRLKAPDQFSRLGS